MINPVRQSDLVAIVLPHLKVGGAQKQAVKLAVRLQELGTPVAMVLTNPPRDEPSEDEKFLVERGVPVLHSSPANQIAFLERMKELLGRIKQLLLRVAHSMRLTTPWRTLKNLLVEKMSGRFSAGGPNRQTFGVGGFFLGSVMLALGIGRPRKIVSAPGLIAVILLSRPGILLHSLRLRQVLRSLSPAKSISFLTQTNIHMLLAQFDSTAKVIVSERNDVDLVPHPEWRVILRNSLYPLADEITANSEASTQSLLSLFPDSRCSWLPNQIDFDKPTHQVSARQPRLVVACRLVPYKRVGEIVEAFEMSGVSDRGWGLDIYGSGPDERGIKTLIEDLKVASTVKLHGELPRSEIGFHDAAFLIVNSEFEGSSNSLHEAVAAGCIPIVSRSVREISSILNPELYAQLTFNGVDELSERLENLCFINSDTETLLARVSEGFREYWDRSEKVLDAYLRVLTETAELPLVRPSSN